MREYPMLVVDTLREGKYFRLAMNDRFPELDFIISRYEGKFRIDPTDDISDIRYLEIYQYAQAVFREYYEE